jgi:hypothetical protein
MKKMVAIPSLAFSAAVFFACLSPAAAKTSTGHMTVNEVETSCIDHSGTVTAGSGKGGYGCNYPSGNKVSCTGKGNCTFTTPSVMTGASGNLRTNAPVSALNRNIGTSGAGMTNGSNILKSDGLTNRSVSTMRPLAHP